MDKEDALEYQARAFEMIERFYIKSGFFTRPFETVESLERRLKGIYSEVNVSNVESIAVFQCRK